MKIHKAGDLSFILINQAQVDYYESVPGRLPEAPLIDWAKQFLTPGSVFLDIGAHCGTWSISLAKAVKDTRVFSFEPQLSTFYQLCGGIALNDLQNQIKAFRVAMGSKLSAAVLRQVSLDGGGSSIHDLPTHTPDQVIHHELVDVETLDSFVNSHDTAVPATDAKGSRKISLIKIDVEGHEADVLRGARETLRFHRPKILLESWDPKVRPWAKKLREDTFDVLETLGYAVISTTWPDMILAEPRRL